MDSLDFKPIGIIHSCYQEKFGIPRQPSLVTATQATLTLNDEFNEESVRGLEGFSHIWIQFVFHATQQQGWKTMVRPPRLGGNKKVGVFASRSTFRPNSIGLSVIKLNGIEFKNTNVVLKLSGHDLLDKTPVLDIKPYLPYVDAIPDAIGGFATQKPPAEYKVVFSDDADRQCKLANARFNEDIKTVIEQILSFGPKPSYQQTGSNRDRVYAVNLYDFDLSWQYCENDKIKVLAINL